MKKSFLQISATIALVVASRATTVIPPTFEQLVDQADTIFQGTVTNVRSVWSGEGALRHIESYVTFQIEDSLKGTPGQSYTIQILGGTVDGETMEVTDSPKFVVGDRDILFVEHNGEQFVPLVGINHGRFHIKQHAETGREIITNGEDAPVRDVKKFGREEESVTAAEAISPTEFKSAIKQRLATHPSQ
jgi:hypothetical protein